MSWQEESFCICQRRRSKHQDSGSQQKGTLGTQLLPNTAGPEIVRKNEGVHNQSWQVKGSLSLILKNHFFLVATYRLLRNNILCNVYNFGFWVLQLDQCFLGSSATTNLNTSLSKRFFFALHQFRARCWNEMKNYFIPNSEREYFAKSHAWGRKVVHPFLQREGIF